ncbi:MAG: MarR family transcriptional regulator [Hungatella sp.]|nr:MarR family transcriptional regulator [Hungatella sp.]
MRKRLDTKEGCLVMKYIQTARMHRKVLEQGLSSTGVYRSQHHLLMFVADHPQVSQKELARLHGVSTATIAVSLKKLEQGGYIERKVDVKDNRYNQICITAKGMAAVERSAAIFEDLEKRMFQGFSAEDFEKLEELLDRLYGNLEACAAGVTGNSGTVTGQSQEGRSF